MPETQSEIQQPPPDHGSILNGFLVAAGWNFLAAVISAALIPVVIGIPLTAGFVLLQFAWLIPIWRRFRKVGKTENAKGVLIVAGISVLLSAACWVNLSNMNIH